MSKTSKNDVRPNKFYQAKTSAVLYALDALDSSEGAKAFAKANPDHALSKPFKSKKQQRRHGK